MTWCSTGKAASISPISASATRVRSERIDPKTGEATVLYKEVNGHLLSAPNDLVFDREGGFYFTDLGKRYPRPIGADRPEDRRSDGAVQGSERPSAVGAE